MTKHARRAFVPIIMNASEIKTHVTVLGVLFLLSGFASIVIGAFVFILFLGIGAVAQDWTAFSILGGIGTIAAVVQLVSAIPAFIAAYALLRNRGWGRLAGIIVGAIFLLSFPIGTAIGIYALFVLGGDAARTHFDRSGEAATA